MKKLASALLLILGAYSTSFAQKDTGLINYADHNSYILGGINVRGDEYLDRNIVLSIAGLAAGQKINIPGEEITRAIQNLWNQQLFSNVRFTLDSVANGKAYLGLDLKTQPRLARFSFSGISKAHSKKLSEEIGISSRDIVTEQLLSTVKARIIEFYAKKGYPAATVNIERKADTLYKNNSVVLKINVNKGKRTKIKQINFEGNTAFADKRLRRLMKKTKVSHPLKNLLRGSKFQPEEYENDKASIVAFYRDHGYKDAKIISDTTWFTEGNKLNINIRLQEGNVYHFRDITWAGNTKYDSRFLNAILGIKKGDVYNEGLLEKNLYINPNGLDVTSLYMDDGYLFFSATPVETSVENDSVDIEIRIFEGPQATINKVTVTGNTKTHDHVILRELRTKPGQKFSRADIIRSQRELAQLGYFDPEKMAVNPKPNMKDGTVDIEYVVSEKPSDQIELSGGWGAGTLVGVLGLSLNNFSAKNVFKPKLWQGYPSGDGQKLAVRAQTNGPAIQAYNISFTEPWFGGKKPNSLTFSAFYSIQRYNYRSKDSFQELRTPGLSVGLGKRLKWPDDYFTLFHSISYQYYTFTRFPFISNFPDGTGYSNNLNIRHILSRSSVSDPIYPRSGSQVIFQLQWTPPYSLFSKKDYTDLPAQQKYKWIEYHKWKFDASNYLGLGPKKKFVIMTSANFGLIGLYNHNLGLTPFERFYVGGDGLAGYNLDGRELIRLRGYKDYDAITPSTTTETGATLYNKYTFELRYPVATSQAATVYGLAFLEGGNAWNRFKDFNPFEMKRSAGLGVRVFLPMFGLLGFDWGYGFDKPLGGIEPSGNQFHFYIGQPLF